MSTPETSPPGREETHLEARASDGARIYQAGRDQHIAERDLHLHYEDGVRRSRRTAPDAPVGECPYPGLAAFDEGQARWFFGRDAVTADLLVRLDERLRTGGALALVAPSGAGKSSLLRAGLLPALARGALPVTGSAAWPRLLLTPGTRPVETLADRLAAVAGVPPQQMTEAIVSGPRACVALLGATVGDDGARRPRPVVVVDQLEELFTLCASEDERHIFLDVLTALAYAGPDREGPPGLVVYGLRSDFYTPCADRPQLRAVLQDGQLVIGSMTPGELREVILFPAREADLEIEPGLVELLLRDLGTPADGTPDPARARSYEAGRLPLLAHALRATWQQRHGHTLTVDGYQATGGIRHAVATTAERLHAGLTPAEQHTARALFLRLVRIGDGVDDTRRRLSYADLLDVGPDPATAAAVVDTYTRGRLLTRHQDTVEITHEALLHAWPELRRWIDTDRAGHLVHQDLEEDAADWERAHHDPGMLYRGHRLESARAWASGSHRSLPSPTASAFLTASVRLAHRTRRLRRAVIAMLTALALIATATAVVAFRQSATARAQRDKAVFNQIKAEAGQWRESQASLAAQLDLVARRMKPDAPDMDARLVADASGFLSVSLTGGIGYVEEVAFRPDGRLLAAGGDTGTQLWDMADPVRPRVLGGPFTDARTGNVTSVVFSPDGHVLAVVGWEGARLWNVADPGHPVPLGRLSDDIETESGGQPVNTVAFSPDRRILATDGDDGTWLWDFTNPAHPKKLGRPLPAFSPTFSSDGHVLAAQGEKGVQLWDVSDPTHPKKLGLPFAATGNRNADPLTFSPDRRILATDGDQGTQLWDVNDPARPVSLGPPLMGAEGDAEAAAFGQHGHTLAITVDRTVRLWRLGDGDATPAGRLLGYNNTVDSVAISRDGNTLATTGDNDVVRLWTKPRMPLIGATGVVSVAFGQGGHLLATAGYGGTRLWDTADPAHPKKLATFGDDPHEPAEDVAFAPGGHTLVTNESGGAQLWDVTDPAHPKQLGQPLANGDPGPIESVAFSPRGHLLATGGSGGTRLWDVADPAHPRALSRPFTDADTAYDLSVAFSPDGRTLATGGDDGARVWDVTNPDKPSSRRLGRTEFTDAVAFSPDGDTLCVTGGWGGTRLWDATNLAHPKVLGAFLSDADTSPATSVTFSPDGSAVATVSEEGTRLWDVTDRTQAESLGPPFAVTHVGGVSSVAFSPDGRTLAIGGDDGTALWNTDVSQAVKRICRVTPQALTRQQWEQHIPGLPFNPPCP
ncbi:PQQ-binding-like beta-propeller repeat protein [Streptomyces plumbiresistens]|uniref:Novel STAND NTPase 1 domain-containing protein n=1 Tax=Streptomyces plumbiresistens TaxID=511811 RepID=A0ABP7TJF0_9ACTN